jgi:dihydroflavonol-4-reductase
MRVLVTGSSGFLGAQVVRELGAAGHAVRALIRPGRGGSGPADSDVEVAEGDLADEESLRKALRGCDGVVHAAAFRTARPVELELQRRTNVEGTSRLLRAAQAAQVARLVHVSSMAAVGFAREPVPLSESVRWNVGELGIEHFDTKKEAEERALAGAWAGMDLSVVNPGTLCGARFGGGAHELVAALRAGRLRASPAGGASVVDVADAARGCVLALERGRRGERYLLGGTNVSWHAFDSALAHEIGAAEPAANAGLFSRLRATPEHDAMRPAGAWFWIDDAKARAEIGHTSRPLVETVRAACAVSVPPARGR